MGLSVNIYGSLIYTPDNPLETLVDGFGLDKNEQFWQRKELPSFFDTVEVDKSGSVFLTSQQEAYAWREVERCKNGHWFFNNGQLTYITGKHYFYLQWFVLEDGIYPDYRDTDRRYFLFLNYWERIRYCIGIIRGKKRREGASSQACSNLLYEAIFLQNSKCGLISKSKDDSRDTFTEMISPAYRQLPIFLKPTQLNDPDSVTEIVLSHKSTSNKDGVVSTVEEDKGNRSKINYRAPVLNAYDRGRMSRLLLDEFGKLEKDVPASLLFSIVAKTLIKGIKRVGFVEMPSTVNKLTKGGSEFRLLWDNADQSKTPGKPTINRLVRYFTPAFDGLEGFIDKFGMSVISEPTHEQYQWLVNKWVEKDPFTGETISEIDEEDIKLGAWNYLLKRREGLTGDLLEEEIRMNPCSEIELFMAANADCIFNLMNLNNQIEYLKQNPVFKRKVIFYRDLDQVVKWRDAQKNEETFCWEIVAFPPSGQENKYTYQGVFKKPGRTEDGVIGVDGYSNSQGGKKYGSKASAWMFRKYDIRDPENTGLFIGHLYGRPAEKDDLHNQILLAAEYMGYNVYYEFVADDYYTYFKNRGKLGYLAKFPMNAIAPEKKVDKEKVQRHYGFPTTDFALTKQNDAMITYIQHYYKKIYWSELCEDAKTYDPSKRTPSDRTVSAMITLVGSMELAPPKPKPVQPLVTVYENEHYKGPNLGGQVVLN